jgi:hypothetical protein
VVRGGVEPPTFRFSGITTSQVTDEVAAWIAAAERPRLALVGDVAVTVAVSSAGVRLPGASRAGPEGRSRPEDRKRRGSAPPACRARVGRGDGFSDDRDSHQTALPDQARWQGWLPANCAPSHAYPTHSARSGARAYDPDGDLAQFNAGRREDGPSLTPRSRAYRLVSANYLKSPSQHHSLWS